jgi:WD40 repeat protein/DNA-binding SARP family transcriptional activator
VEFKLLGPLEVERDGGAIPLGGPKQRAALAHLLLRANTLVPADRLIDEVWADGDGPPAAARNVLQSYISRLRRTLGADRLEHRPGGYLLHADASEIDVHRFEALAREARTRAASDPAAAVRLYREADELCRGPALDDLSDQPSLRGDIAHLEELRAAANEGRIVLELGLGRHAELVAELETLTALQPLRERLWLHLMTALYRSGRQADALAAYRRAREELGGLGLEPSPDLKRLERQVLQQDPALEIVGVPVRGFRLLERVGEGSFGVVHRALQPQVEREVAIKVVRPGLADDPEFIRRFEAEAQLVARLEHPHIVPLYDYWREPGGAFLVMRFLRGGNLREALARGPLAVDGALRIVDHVGAALASAHRQGVVHRDVKPANVLFDEEGNAYLSDFGIARDVAAAHVVEARAAPGSSAYYLSPEESRGQAPNSRADVYSLGLVLFEMLAGGHPFADVRPEDLRRRGHAPVPSLRSVRIDVDPGIDEIVRRATLEDPDDRYTDASALLSALAEAVGPARRPVAARAVRNPYKGLRPFLEPDAPDFLGRETLVRRLVERLADEGHGSRLLVLVGPSGSGKSSAVRAGLIPAVRAGAVTGSERWFVAEMVPGADPFAELVAALLPLAPAAPPPDLLRLVERGDDGLVQAAAWLLPGEAAELLLVIDQLEELFTLVEDEDERARFLAMIRAATTHPASRVRIVATLRADFFDRPLAYGDFAELVRARTEVIVPLTAEELERAISGPARRVGARVDSALLAQLVSDVAGQPGALPLLQFTLAELFDRRHEGTLTMRAYEDLGGVAGAVAHSAEEIYGTLTREQKAAARQLFLRLVEAADGAVTRRRVLRSELFSIVEDAPEMEAAVDAFASRRLLSLDRDAETRAPTVDLAHEALLHAWERLRRWIDEARDDLRTQRQLATAVREWLDARREPSFLIGGSRLEQLESWRARSGLGLTPAEREFLDASMAERERLRVEDAARQARERELERRSLRRLRGLVAMLAAAALVAGGLTVFAFDQRSDADRERRIAVARELAAAAVASLDVDAERSILLALEAVEQSRSGGGPVLPEVEEALHRAVVASRIVLRVPGLGGALDWSPDGSLFVTEGPEQSGVIDIRDAATGKSVRSFRGHDADVNLAAFSADGSMLATSGDDGAVNVWDPATGKRLRSFHGRGGPVWGASFSPDGSLLAAASWDERAVRIWDLRTGRRILEIAPVTASFVTGFSPDGRRLAIPTFDSGTVVADVRSGRVIFRLQGQQSGVHDVDWSPDGRWLATSSADGTIRIWDARTGRSRFTLHGHTGQIFAADWSADSRRLVTGSNDGTAKIWEITPEGTRELLSISAQERGGGLWVAFSPDGDRIMTGDQEITAVKIWDVSLNGDAEWANVPTDPADLSGVAFAADGAGLVAGDGDGSLAVWDAETGRRLRTIGRRSVLAPPLDIDVSSDGMLAAATGGVAKVWRVATGRQVFSASSDGGVEALAWSADGSLLATGSNDGLISIVDRSGRQVAALRAEQAIRISALRFTPDGRLLAAARLPFGDQREEPRVTIWDWKRRTAVSTIPVPAEGVAFSPDGARVAIAPNFGPVSIWKVRTGERVARLVGHTGTVNDVEFAPDGSLLATGSVDATVRLWDPSTGVQRLVLRGHDGVIWDVAFSPDGSKLASASPDGTVRVWALDLDDLIAIAKRKVTRELTPEECRQYLHVAECN